MRASPRNEYGGVASGTGATGPARSTGRLYVTSNAEEGEDADHHARQYRRKQGLYSLGFSASSAVLELPSKPI